MSASFIIIKNERTMWQLFISTSSKAYLQILNQQSKSIYKHDRFLTYFLQILTQFNTKQAIIFIIVNLLYQLLMQQSKADYKMLKQIGQGSFGSVYLVQDKKGKKFALKKVIVDPFDVQQSLKEIQVMKKLVHVNLIRIYDSSFQENQGTIEIIMEYCQQGDLLRYYKKKNPLSVSEIIKIFKQIVQAFIVMNGKGVIHRDLKPQNILISKGLVVKIADFGCARSISTFDMSKVDNFSLDKGTPIYASPELLMNQKYSSKCDVWSAGVLLFFIYYGNHPFMDQKTYNTLKKIKQMTENKVLQLPSDSDATIARILSLTLIYQDKQRASWRQLCLSRLFVDKIQNIKSYLQYTKNVTIIANWIAKQFWKSRKNFGITKHKDQFFVYFIIKFQCTCMLQAKQINKNNDKWKYLFEKQPWEKFNPDDILVNEVKKFYGQHEKYFVTIKKSMETKEVYNLIKEKQTKRTSLYNDLDNSVRSAYKILVQIKDQIPAVNDGSDYRVWVMLARWINFQRWYWFQRDPRIQKFLIQPINNPRLLIQTQLERYETGILE